MRRKPRELVPFENELVEAAKQLRQDGIDEFYGFQIAKRIEDSRLSKLAQPPSRFQRLRAYVGTGTLYRALDRLQKMGILQNRWEELPPGENRPRRRYYRLIDKPKREGNSHDKT